MSLHDTIYVYPDAAAASEALDQSAKGIQELSAKAAPTPADVGTGGQIAIGPSRDGNKAKGVLTFAEGKVFTVLESESPARKQDAAIKSGLPA
jgi:hypothetical protein